MSRDSGQSVAGTSTETDELIVVQIAAPATPQRGRREAASASSVAPTLMDAPCPAPPCAKGAARPLALAPVDSLPEAAKLLDNDDELYQTDTAQTRAPLSFRQFKSPANFLERLPVSRAKPDKVTFAPATPDHLVAQVIEDTDRETLADAELFKLFQQRLCLTADLGLLLLPLFTLIYVYLSPAAWRGILASEGCLMLLCLAARGLAPRMPTLLSIRLLTLTAYALFSMGSAAVLAQMSSDPILGHNQIIAYAGHQQLMLSTLLLPFSLMESLTVMVIAMGSLAWATWWTADPMQSDFYLSQLFVFQTTALFVACIAHFQDKLRRQAFAATFELAHHAAQSQKLSTVDPVTSGSNRRHLEIMLAQEIARAARFGHPLSVIMFDLDNFKQVNDTLGHRAGDEVLQQVWQMATATVREIDAVARYGGDEFTVVLPQTGETDARAVAERLLATAPISLKERFGSQHVASAVTLSIGLVTFHLEQPTAIENILEQADQRLYEAKRRGKNQIVTGVSGRVEVSNP